MSLYKNKYRSETTRLQNWDYSWPGYYFITICTKNREPFFGKIINGEMRLSEMGEIVFYEWQQTKHMRDGVDLDEFVIMPNHLHGIVIIKNNVPSNVVGTYCNASLRNKNNLSNIIRGFKSATTIRVRENINKNFAWQSRFYEHIIRNQKSLNNIREYIRNNPIIWCRDRNKS